MQLVNIQLCAIRESLSRSKGLFIFTVLKKLLISFRQNVTRHVKVTRVAYWSASQFSIRPEPWKQFQMFDKASIIRYNNERREIPASDSLLDGPDRYRCSTCTPVFFFLSLTLISSKLTDMGDVVLAEQLIYLAIYCSKTKSRMSQLLTLL